MGPHVRRIESLVPRRTPAFGGKAKNLAALARAGFPVPAAFAVAAEVCDDFLRATLAPDEQPAALLAAPSRDVTPERLADIAARVRRAPLTRAIAADVHAAFATLRKEGARAIAVRSSSLREDEQARSAAGLHDTVLGVEHEDALDDALRAVWASSFDPRVLGYLRALGSASAEAGLGMGVVLQALVPADVAGVLFTVNPLSADPGEMVINASLGLGKTVVDGSVSPDTYRVDKASGWVRDRVIGDKARAIKWDDERGVIEEDVPAEARAQESLSDDVLDRLIELGVRIEDHFGDARDIEWAVVGRNVYVLQARPVTAIVTPPRRASSRRARRADRARIVWSNVNVGEALPGVATPFTWSVLSGFSDRGFRRAFGALGCSVPKDAELVGNFRGRIYLNMSEFTAIASQVPGLRPRVLLSLGGGGEIDRLEHDVERRGSAAFLARLPMTASRYVRENARLGERVAQFEKWFEAERARIDAIDFRVLSATALHRVLGEVERLLDPTGEVLLNVYGNLLACVVALRALVSAVADEPRADSLMRELLTGLDDVDSAAPGLALYRIARIARGDLRARDHILRTPPAELRVASIPEGPTRRALLDFFARYGGRGAREAEIAEPRWREDPTLPFTTLRLHLMSEHDEGPEEVQRRQLEVRERAQAELEGLLPLPVRLSGGALAVRKLLTLVQDFMRLREHLRGHVVTVLGLYREVVLDASRRLAAMEPGCGPDGGFFLTVDELHALLKGDVGPVSVLIRRRRLQYERDRALPPPPDTFVGFPPPVEAEALPDGALRGLGASTGRVIGTARVVETASDATALAPGEVLVVQQADVGWTPLFLAAAAIVTDLGGPLSHASVVAREFGVPAVVNVRHGTRVIRTGDRVEVDGDAGTVRIVERAHATRDREEHARDATPRA
ncbi:PEP/pyruvate-binding domain-containing protein [Sandaracinus amylolyticus]|uniref:Phosphoenolpyruvate synthase n=1 Tax=Sandaracinus amylolyticus TaxID=927083 RepID=A0A0F6YJP5_9BACT|nr:PEP/pyruvate-binding domain-containing protein [Sandaracinus amylolyticus]AKF07245.1 Phosphoenolpyruvate synthase [Sandaracinus amylolyticus]